ncbi:pyruvate ferredoxin oxidoreductase beta subunit PorB [Candidatus Methanoplasma termitum]|uniref:PorB protein n=1 Tax=Candidatus Methanoplasma termitum TaxID=1577791 RepID=A0A0A7LGN7_9ARCH|nr:thiamine pyrophosphate-dependent enzyme [Candidatus Methanoplasma termitum]AIZ56646.1 pyruvate ferredoxin oxidoreductase beta subunit PorB [Candidatus Methanoplasma termitum]
MTAVTLQELNKIPVRLASGHRLCAGCTESVIAKQILMGTEKNVVVSAATGCLQVSTTLFPYTSWKTPYIHTAFGNAAATCAGVETAYKALKRQGKVKEDVKFVTFAGDGGTYDIGLQALSGAAERGHNMLYVCLNNEAYMNTGIQRSSATGIGASTTTSWAGDVAYGKKEFPKDMTRIMAAHGIPYAAQAAPHAWKDMIQKAQRAFETEGPTFINAITPCPRGWRFATEESISISRLAVETCIWPLYEVENGINYNLSPESQRIADGKAEKKPVTEWINSQGRFSHLKGDKWKSVVESMQAELDKKWESLLKLCKL